MQTDISKKSRHQGQNLCAFRTQQQLGSRAFREPVNKPVWPVWPVCCA